MAGVAFAPRRKAERRSSSASLEEVRLSVKSAAYRTPVENVLRGAKSLAETNIYSRYPGGRPALRGPPHPSSVKRVEPFPLTIAA